MLGFRPAFSAWWHSERRLKAAQLPPGHRGRREHVADAEIHWPSIDGSPHAGQVWAIEVELTPKPLARTSRIMTELLTAPRYARVVYLTAPAAGPVVTRAVATLPPDERARITAQNLPRSALTWQPDSLSGPGSLAAQILVVPACRTWQVFLMRHNATRPPSCMR